MITVIKSYRI